MRELTGATRIRIKRPRPKLTGDTRIRLSQVLDFYYWNHPLIDDAHKYNIGEISQKTGLQKCLINGRTVWLLPGQNSNFLNKKMSKPDTKQLAKSCKKARADGYVSFKSGVKNGARNYLNHMTNTWKTNPVKVPFLNNATIGINKFSHYHLFNTKGKPRSLPEIKRRAECLPYVRDILERTGKPADHYTNSKGQESYSIVGKANIGGKDRELQVIISKDSHKNHYYLSVFRLKK